MTRPITAPSTIAMANATATRASVAPRLKASAPERASCDDRERHRLRVRQQARAGELRARIPGRDQQHEREEPQRQVHSAAAGR